MLKLVAAALLVTALVALATAGTPRGESHGAAQVPAAGGPAMRR